MMTEEEIKEKEKIDTESIMRMDKYLTDAGLFHTLTCSTLLGIYRDKKPLGKILEFDILEKDATPENIEKLTNICSIIRRREGDMGYSIFDLKGFEDRPFEIQIMRFTDKYAYKNLCGKDCLVWPRYMFDKFDTIKWNGITWNTPFDIENYLKVYYGDTWKTPQAWGWHNAPNYKQLNEVLEGKVEFNI